MKCFYFPVPCFPMFNLFSSKPMERICTKCKENKPISEYHKDTKGALGYAARCKTCKNGSRKIQTIQAPIFKQTLVSDQPEAKIVTLTKKKPTKVTIEEEIVIEKPETNKLPKSWPINENLLDRLSERFGSCYTITVQKDRKCVMQVHSFPSLAFKAMSPADLLEKVMC